ncbi:hypothetical protein CEXT_421691 [Caerostris extrusa]|uniref:Uncharacterized protein n=1 Tax=Caerostris extrusa TaxID=172846 RepID=A0AAV4WVM5_CAEEX|nr:hypothetical protein CEXT_421691 [Caerostris extrusa]
MCPPQEKFECDVQGWSKNENKTTCAPTHQNRKLPHSVKQRSTTFIGSAGACAQVKGVGDAVWRRNLGGDPFRKRKRKEVVRKFFCATAFCSFKALFFETEKNVFIFKSEMH